MLMLCGVEQLPDDTIVQVDDLIGDGGYCLYRCRAALNSRNCLQDDEVLQLNLGILDSQCT